MGLKPALHPDVTALGFPDLGQLHNTATTGTLERIIAKALFDPLAPFEVLEGLGQGFQVKEGGLEAKGIQGSADDWDEIAFHVAGVQTGVADHLHSLRWNMGDHARDEVESGTGDGDTPAGGSVGVPVGNELTVVVGDAGGGQGRVTQVAADVFGGIEAFWIEAVGVDLVAAMVVVASIDGLSQLLVKGTCLSKVLTEEVAPLGSQMATRQFVDLHPLAVFEAAFGHHEVDVGFVAQITSARVEGVDHTNTHAGIELLHQFTDGLRCRLEDHLQERAVDVEAGPQQVVDGEGDVEMRDVVEVAGDVGNPVVDADLAAGGAEAGLAGERDTTVEPTTGTDVAGVAAVGIAAEDHAFDGLAYVCLLIGRDFSEAQITPDVPVVAKDGTEAVVGGGMVGVAPGG